MIDNCSLFLADLSNLTLLYSLTRDMYVGVGGSTCLLSLGVSLSSLAGSELRYGWLSLLKSPAKVFAYFPTMFS